eukprot:TRINITY_DN416_c0_g1_i1.p1 TRINITY_DN416_c0_g1~~TRINITY_DN416_c0_g1_i1.p1  ORF type:complete len:232 (+),score=99.67 TRINITY_DN416_c0_g1_i1:76-771(+)
MDSAALLALAFPEEAKPLEVQEVTPERVEIYARLLPELKGSSVAAVLCDLDGEKVQHLVVAGDAGPRVVVVEEGCKIMLDDLSPTQMVEYRFKEHPEWHVGYMSECAMEGYRAQKFKTWKQMIDEPSCKAAFKRLLHTGLVTKLYDTVALPTPESDKAAWIVTNEETGKPIHVPHPVEEMRIWDATQGEYRTLSARLVGAPNEEDEEKYWQDLLTEQREKHGSDVIQELLA